MTRFDYVENGRGRACQDTISNGRPEAKPNFCGHKKHTYLGRILDILRMVPLEQIILLVT